MFQTTESDSVTHCSFPSPIQTILILDKSDWKQSTCAHQSNPEYHSIIAG